MSTATVGRVPMLVIPTLELRSCTWYRMRCAECGEITVGVERGENMPQRCRCHRVLEFLFRCDGETSQQLPVFKTELRSWNGSLEKLPKGKSPGRPRKQENAYDGDDDLRTLDTDLDFD